MPQVRGGLENNQVSIIVAHRESNCKTGQGKSGNYLGNSALSPLTP